jgi:hypothetical protein
MVKEKPKKEKPKLVNLTVKIPSDVKSRYKTKLAAVDETMQNHVLLMILHYLKHGDFKAAAAN